MEAVIPDIAHAQEQHADLKATHSEVVRLTAEIAGHESALSDAFKKREEGIARGRRLRNLLKAALQNHFGFDSPELLKFDIRPADPRRRRKKKAEATPTTASSAGQGAA